MVDHLIDKITEEVTARTTSELFLRDDDAATDANLNRIIAKTSGRVIIDAEEPLTLQQLLHCRSAGSSKDAPV